jgi:uroporphyrinogen III methyltransferase/synthase
MSPLPNTPWPRHLAPARAADASGPDLSGWSLILTRPEGADAPLAEALAAMGADVIEAPAIEFASFVEQNVRPCLAAIQGLRAAEGWLVLPSPTAVRQFAALVSRLSLAPDVLAGIRLALVGQGSAREAEACGLRTDFVAPHPRGEALAEALPAVPGTPVLIAGSTQTRPELRNGLALRGFAVQVLPLYAPRPSRAGLQAILDALVERPDRVLIVTSPSGVDAIRAQAIPPTPAARWVAIGPTTARRLEKRGIAADRRATAATPDARGVAEAVLSLPPAG